MFLYFVLLKVNIYRLTFGNLSQSGFCRVRVDRRRLESDSWFSVLVIPDSPYEGNSDAVELASSESELSNVTALFGLCTYSYSILIQAFRCTLYVFDLIDDSAILRRYKKWPSILSTIYLGQGTCFGFSLTIYKIEPILKSVVMGLIKGLSLFAFLCDVCCSIRARSLERSWHLEYWFLPIHCS